jgi:peptidoglycan/LPS O-acetylase OafA/YrhL
MKRNFYHPELDCLRFVAFLAVFLHHCLPQDTESYRRLGAIPAAVVACIVKAGGLGVDLFFCLSSFLITLLLLREVSERGAIDVRSFWIRRILRIWPLYYAFLLASVVVVPRLLPGNTLNAYYVSSFAFLGGNWACAFSGYPPSVAAPLWSVSIEEQFYLAWPLLLAALSVRRLPLLAIICLAIATLVRGILVLLQLPHPAIWCNTFARLDPIAFGALFAVYCNARQYTLSAKGRRWLSLTGLVIPPLLLLILGDSAFYGFASLAFYPAVAFCCLLILAGTYTRIEPDHDLQRTGSASKFRGLLVYLGRISYGLYVFHVFAIAFVDKAFRNGPGGSMQIDMICFFGRRCLAFLLTVALASVSYALIEKPFLRLKKRYSHIESVPISGAGRPQCR